MSLKEYQRKRKFHKTPEPVPKIANSRGGLTFVIQKHAATRTHYDFRLELDGVLKSWAVPKGPSLTSQDPRLAVQVEDHPLKYGKFEGVIPKGNYGAGTVMIWDTGTYVERSSKGRKDSEKALRVGLDRGHITFLLSGQKLCGEFALIKLKKKGAPDNGWLLVKKHDEYATRMDILKEDRSVVSGRSMEDIAEESAEVGDVWIPGKGRRGKASAKTFAAAERKRAPIPKLKKAPPKTAMPRKTRVMQPVVSAKVPPGDWVYEDFGDGVRAVAEIDHTGVKFYSKMFLPFHHRYPKITMALKQLRNAVVDGEIRKNRYVISDILFFEGKDLRDKPWRERREILDSLNFTAPLEKTKISESPISGVAKRADSKYVSGLSRDWLKVKSAEKTTKSPDRPPLTHLGKVFWPDEGYTKGDLVAYYESISSVILPYLYDRPQSLHRQPDGVRNEGFFHKDMVGYLPKRIETVKVFSGSAEKTVNYLICQDRWTLLYLVNLGCIELNPWLSRKKNLENPDLVVIDLDPDGNDFEEVIEVAQGVHQLLDKIGAKNFCKTSGASGLHICIPTQGKFDYDTGREFAEAVCREIQTMFPKNTSVERNPARRRGKIYLDFLQNRRGQTLAAPYCARPRAGATVSAPLKWSEVKRGLNPARFTIKNIKKRIEKVGDLWKPMLTESVDIEKCLKKLTSRS